MPVCDPEAREHAAQRQRRGSESLGGVVTPPGMSHSDTSDNGTYLFPPDFPCPGDGPGAFLVDRLTVVVPILCQPEVVPRLGVCYWIDADGCLERSANRRAMVEGSWTGRCAVEVHACPVFDEVMLRRAGASRRELRYLRIDGNPAKWFMPSNVFGSPLVYDQAVALTRDVVAKTGIVGELCFDGAYLNRVDATYNFDLGSFAEAASLIRQMSRMASVAHRRASGFDTSLLFPGRRSSLSVYHKGPELRVHPGRFCPDWLLECADRIVRFEVVSRSERLDEFGLRRLARWRYDSHVQLFRLWLSFVSRLRFPAMCDVDLSALTMPAKRLYTAWASGQDVCSVFSRSTVYRHRLAILRAGGPDISLPRPSGDVVEFRRVLRPRAAVPPPEFGEFLASLPRRVA